MEVLRSVTTPHPVIRSCRYNEACEYAITTGSDRTIKLWNPITSSLLKTYSGHSQDVFDAVSSLDNSEIVSAGGDKAVYLFDVITGVIKRRFLEHMGKVNCVRFNNDSSVIISASDDNTIKLWDTRVKNNSSTQTLKDSSDAVTFLDVSEFEILSCSLDKCSRLYDIRVGQMLCDFVGDELTCCKFGADYQLLLMAGLKCPVRLFDRMTGELFNEYNGATSEKYKLECAFAAEDKLVVSGSEDGKVFIWNLVDGQLLSSGKVSKASTAVTSIVAHKKEKWAMVAQGSSFHVLDVTQLTKLSNTS